VLRFTRIEGHYRAPFSSSKWLLFDAVRENVAMVRRVRMRRVTAGVWMPGKTRLRQRREQLEAMGGKVGEVGTCVVSG